MKKFINGKLYDTDTATKVLSYDKDSIQLLGVIRIKMPATRTIYKTKKGNYFFIDTVPENFSVKSLTPEVQEKLRGIQDLSHFDRCGVEGLANDILAVIPQEEAIKMLDLLGYDYEA